MLTQMISELKLNYVDEKNKKPEDNLEEKDSEKKDDMPIGRTRRRRSAVA